MGYGTYSTLLKNGMIDSARVSKEFVYIKSGPKEFKIPKELVDLEELYKNVPVSVTPDYGWVYDLFLIVLLAFFIGYIIYYLKRQKSEPIPIEHKIQIAPANEIEDRGFDIEPQVSEVKFKDVAAIEEVKEELEEIIDYLKNPQKYRDFGIRMPKGVLLVGPPGVGKTLIAKAVAGEAGVPFFYQSGSAFVQIYVGMGAKRVRELFSKAKQMAPSIIFIDEIDAIGKARGGMRNDEREATLNQLLTEMDGFKENSEVIVIGATNKIEVLDEALLRPGRFDRRVFVSLPNREDRKKILQIYLKRIPHSVDIETLATMTTGFSGAALSSLVNEAALNALKKGKRVVELDDFEDVRDKVIFGKRKILSLSQKEKQIQAVYQAAKALGAYWFNQDFDKITLIGGRIKGLEKELLSKEELFSRIKTLLCGYCALREFYDEEFSISAEDIKEAKLLAQEMIERYAMGDEGIFASPAQTQELIRNALDESQAFVSSKKGLIERLKNILLNKESLTKEEIKKEADEIF